MCEHMTLCVGMLLVGLCTLSSSIFSSGRMVFQSYLYVVPGLSGEIRAAV